MQAAFAVTMRTSILGFVFASRVVSQEIQEIQERALNWTIGQTVQTTSGPVNGHAALNGTIEVSEYLGIPYAIPPVGDLRWTAPQKYTGNSTISGTSFGFSCPANFATSSAKTDSGITTANLTAAGIAILEGLAQAEDSYSEDCLTINVWTKPQVGEAQKAVLVWVYGGGFSTGNSDNPGYNGQYIADQEDVVLVSFNYRLNIFGFPGSPNATQNLGLLDQRLATEWVRDNIAQFGGDPSRITLFGQSAGGASVDYHTYAWVDDPIAHAFITESGTVMSPTSGLGQESAADAALSWYSITSVLGCGDSSNNPSTVLACMRTKSSSLIMSSLAVSIATFGPTIDETIVFSDYVERSQAGNLVKKPLLIGNADYEAGLFKTTAAIAGIYAPESVWTNINQGTYDCPAAARANISISNGVPTWRYRWFGDFPNTRLTSVPDSGAWHASELPVLFNIFPTGAGMPASTTEEIEIGQYFRGAWAAFAKDPVNGLSNYGGGWPGYDVGAQTLIRLAYQNLTGTNLALGSMYDTGCPVIFEVTPVKGSASGTPSSTTPSSTTSTHAPTKTHSEGNRCTVSYSLVFLILGATCLLLV